MSETAVKKVKLAWHKARNVTKKKNADGVVTKASSPGLTLKQWAKQQVEASGAHAEECQTWLKNKKTLAQKSRKR